MNLHWNTGLQIGAVVMAVLIVLAGAFPGAVVAQSPCSLPARLKIGDAVTVIDGVANRLRQGPGLGYRKLAISLQPGDVWYVLAGPVCANGMNWYQVGAYDAAGWTSEGSVADGYYLGRTTAKPSEGGPGVQPACVSRRLALGMDVAVVDGVRQHIRQQPSKKAPHVAWFNPGEILALAGGPRCADGWVWWQVGNARGRIVGWTSEGDGGKIWLAPVNAGP